MADHGVTVGTIPKASGAKTWANSQIIENATGIGFGVSPSYFVHASKDQNNATSLTISNVNNHVSAYSAITALSDSINQITLVANSTLCTEYSNHCGGLASTGKSLIYLRNITGAVIDNHSDTPLYLATNNVVRMTIPAAGGLNIAALPAGTDNSVVCHDSSGNLVTDEIDSRVWGANLVDQGGTGLTASTLPMASGAGGKTLADSLYRQYSTDAIVDAPLYAETTKRVACGGGTTGAPGAAGIAVTLEIAGVTRTVLCVS
jgi:hypothetical protein